MLRIFQNSLADMWGEVFTSLTCNLAWLLAQATIVAGPPATLALFYTANGMARGETLDLGDFLRAVRRYFGLGWRWGAANLLALAVLGGDALLTARLSDSPLARLAQGFYLAALGGWLLLQLFALPFLFEQQTPSLRLGWRNAAALIGRNPAWAAGIGLLATLALAAGTALFLLSGAVGGIFLALVGNHAVLDRLAAFREHNQAA